MRGCPYRLRCLKKFGTWFAKDEGYIVTVNNNSPKFHHQTMNKENPGYS